VTTETKERPTEVASEVVDRAEVRDGKAIVRYDRTAAALAELKARYAGAKFDCTTTAGDKAARAARQELVQLRTSLDRKRQEFKAPALAFGKAIDSEAKRLTAEIEALELPIDAQIKADEARRERERQAKAEAEAVRLAAIQDRLEGIREGLQDAMMAKTAADVQREIDHRIQNFGQPKREQFEEFYDQAVALWEQTLAGMRRVLVQRQEQEVEAARVAAERAELERLRAEAAAREQAERERIAAEQRAEAEKLAKARAEIEARERAVREEQARLDALAAAERKRLDEEAAARRAEADRQAREAREAEERRLAAERAELQRQQAEEAARIAAQRAEAERAEAEAAAARRREQEAAEAAERQVRDAAPLLLKSMQAIVATFDALPEATRDALDRLLALAIVNGRMAIAVATEKDGAPLEGGPFADEDIPY